MSDERDRQIDHLYYIEKKSMEQVGKVFGISKERVRQLMDRRGRARRKKGERIPRGIKTVKQLFQHVEKTGEVSQFLAKRILKPWTKRCSECGSSDKVTVHLRKKVPRSLQDIDFLCRSCITSKSQKGILPKVQIVVCARYLAGESAKSISESYEVNRNLIYQILRKHRIRTSGHSKVMRFAVQICEKYLAGKSGIELAKEYECTSSSIYSILRKSSVETRKKLSR